MSGGTMPIKPRKDKEEAQSIFFARIPKSKNKKLEKYLVDRELNKKRWLIEKIDEI